MNKILLLFSLFTFSMVQVHAQDMRSIFKSMPDSIVPYLTENNKLDFLDFLDSDMKAEITNRLGGKSEMQTLNDNYLRLILSESSVLEMRLLSTDYPVDSISQIVCMVRTFGTVQKESTISFYSTKWKKLHVNKYISLPQYLFTASLDEKTTMLTIQQVGWLDAPANEEQEKQELLLTKYNWHNFYVKEN